MVYLISEAPLFLKRWNPLCITGEILVGFALNMANFSLIFSNGFIYCMGNTDFSIKILCKYFGFNINSQHAKYLNIEYEFKIQK